MKKALWLFPLLLLLSCRPESESVQRETIKIMTLNIWSGLDYKGVWKIGRYESDDVFEERYQSLLREIETRDPDVIGFNELNTPKGFLRRLKKDLDYDLIFHVGVSGLKIGNIGMPVNMREGDAVLAKRDLNLKFVKRIQLSEKGFARNWGSLHTGDVTQALLTTVTVNDETWYIAVTHLHASTPCNDYYISLADQYSGQFGYTGEEKEKTMQYLRENQEWRNREFEKLDHFLKENVPADAPLIVMGDFNAHDDWPELTGFIGKGYKDTFRYADKSEGYTWDPESNGNIINYYLSDLTRPRPTLLAHLDDEFASKQLRLDYILTGEEPSVGTVMSSEVCGTEEYNGLQPSDHFGVITEFALK